MSTKTRICLMSLIVIFVLAFSPTMMASAYSYSNAAVTPTVANSSSSNSSSNSYQQSLLPISGNSATTTSTPTSPNGLPAESSSVSIQSKLVYAKGTGYAGYSSAVAENIQSLTSNVQLVILPPNVSSGPSKSTSNPVAGQNPGDGYCFYYPNTCANLDYHGGPVMQNAQFVLDFWPGCGSSGCYNSCNGQYYYDGPGIGGADDCHYIFLQELYFQDFCSSFGGAGLAAVMDQYIDSGGNHLGSCTLFAGSASESSSGYSVSYSYDNSAYPGNDCSGSAYSGLSSCLSEGDIQNSANTIGRDVGCNENGITCMVLVFTAYGEPQQGFYPGHDLQYCAYHTYDTYFQFPSFYTTIWATEPDVYWAGSSCGAGVPSPNHDPAGDLEVSPVSHESDEAITDPQLNAYYHTDTAHEIGDECAYDFEGTQSFDGSDIHLGNSYFYDPFEIQSEWSNYNNGCTFSLNGAPTAVELTLTPDSASGTTAQSWTFPIYYVEEGSPVLYSIYYFSVSSPGGSTLLFYQTPDEYIGTSPSCGGNGCLASGSGYSFCFDTNCYFQDIYITTVYGQTTFPSYYYYELLEQQPYMSLIDGGTAPANTIYYSGPATTCTSSPCDVADGASDEFQGLSAALPVSPSTADIYAVWGSSVNAPTCDPQGLHYNGVFYTSYCGTNTGAFPSERWDTGVCNVHLLFGLCDDGITATGEYTVGGYTYWNQYLTAASYFTSDGMALPSNSTLTGTSFSLSSKLTLTTSIQYLWLDSGSSWSVKPSSLKIGSTERFVTTTTSGTITSSSTISSEYFHQFNVKFVASPAGSGKVPASTWYNANSPESIVANPASGYAFSSWSSSTPAITIASPSSASTTITVTATGTVTAHFVPSVKLSLAPAKGTVLHGSAVNTTATISGAPQTVKMSTTGSLPSGVTVKFTTKSVTDSIAGVTDGVQINTSSTTPAGTYTITVVATGADGQVAQATFTLKVK
jgi:hypothetical protein